ncbi:hypothetical protein PORY_002354 [Pneumocystis oryctolagi]|uniref:Uncharacterized protein n=1 Tax=Pneumocystis oryctolagi TaxID=42067 RepID=A0ACB7CB66_9ASCO|nr:hypothetical protein PORY_002354 [Pneumocystis oryctolagi]
MKIKIFFYVKLFLILSSVLSTTYIYTYPLIRGCFSLKHIFSTVPLRLLTFADPQIEGDAKILNKGLKGQIDLWGNDVYLSHIQWAMLTLSFPRPTHQVILGDLMSSQWISDEEYKKRVYRLNWIFMRRLPYLSVFNVSGNHDIGYAGEMTRERVDRWERAFGRVNGAYYLNTVFRGKPRRLRIVILNTLSIDEPVHDKSIRQEALDFLDEMGKEQIPTILLTHLPLYKHKGLCADPPYVKYYENDKTIREQNHLSENSSNLILTRLFNREYNGVIITGHDHQGCDCIRTLNNEGIWMVKRFDNEKEGIREITVRSMMAQYGGYSGIFSAKINEINDKWEFSYYLCPFVVNQIWWGIYIYDIIVVFIFLFSLLKFKRIRIFARGISRNKYTDK